MIGAVALEELPDARGAVHLDFAGTVEHVVPVPTEGSHDRGADQRVGAGNVDARRAFHGRQAAANLRSSWCDVISRICATVSAPNRRSTISR